MGLSGRKIVKYFGVIEQYKVNYEDIKVVGFFRK